MINGAPELIALAVSAVMLFLVGQIVWSGFSAHFSPSTRPKSGNVTEKPGTLADAAPGLCARISGVPFSVAKDIVSDYIRVNSDPTPLRAAFELTSSTPARTDVRFSPGVDFDGLCYFVNYARYPMGIDATKLDVRGWIEVGPAANGGIPAGTKPEPAMLFIDPADQEFDRVWFVTASGQTWALPFSGSAKAFPLEKAILRFEPAPTAPPNDRTVVLSHPAGA